MSENRQESGEGQDVISLKISCPGGLKVTLENVQPSATTVGDLKKLVEEDGGPPAEYLRLLSRGKKLDDDDTSLSNLGILHRTALMGMHNENYAHDQTRISAIEKILGQAESLKDPSVASNVVHERVTQLCCQLDAIDTNGSVSLRRFRKNALARLQAVEEGHQEISTDAQDGGLGAENE